MRRRGLRIATETRPAHSLQQQLSHFILIPPPIKKLRRSDLHEHKAEKQKSGIHDEVNPESSPETSPTLGQKTDENRDRQNEHAEEESTVEIHRDGAMSD